MAEEISDVYFPTKPGVRRAYVNFWVNRATPRVRATSEQMEWREFYGELEIHGVRVVLERVSSGKFDLNNWKVGPPEKILYEDAYLITPAGVAWRSRIGLDAPTEDLPRLRQGMIDYLTDNPDFVLDPENWRLLFPPLPGTCRHSDKGNQDFAIRSDADQSLLPPNVDKARAICVEQRMGDAWYSNWWFEPGKGVVLQEEENKFHETAKEFPIHVQQFVGTVASQSLGQTKSH